MKIGNKIIYGNEIECILKKYEIITNGGDNIRRL